MSESMSENEKFRLNVTILLVGALLAFVESLSEKNLLLEFKANILGDPLNALISWNPSEPKPCFNWTGVFCNRAGAVEKIIVQDAGLEGVLSDSLAGLKSLRVLNLAGNYLNGGIPPEYARLASLRKLNLSRNALSGPIPDFLGDPLSLRMLDLSRNSFNGTIPSSLFLNCSKTRYVSLSHNNLEGSIPASLANCKKLQGFDFSFNDLSGEIPDDIWWGMQSLVRLSLRSNAIAGELSREINSCRNLEFMDVGDNLLAGSIPSGLLNLPNLTHLAIEDNFLTSVLPEILASPSLNHFNASFNQLKGNIPWMKTCGNGLETLDLSGNALEGEIRFGIHNCRSLRFLNLGLNNLSGTIPPEFATLDKLSVLRLGNNSIGGTIPWEIGNIELLQVLELHNLQLFGDIPIALCRCRFLLELDLSGNYLQGEVPETIYNMTYLEVLDLHMNRLKGRIPPTIGLAARLKSLDLSFNSLTGEIPSSIGNLTQLTHFSVAFNNLSGVIPSDTIFQKFGEAPYAGNAGLCGFPLLKSCSVKGGVRTMTTKLLTASVIVVVVSVSLVLMGVCVVVVMNIMTLRRTNPLEEDFVSEKAASSTEWNVVVGKLVLFTKSLPARYEDWETGTKALTDKDCLMGVGTIGTVYKVTFDGGVSIAVKKLQTPGRIGTLDEFECAVSSLRDRRHPNLVSLQGYYLSPTMQLILSEFIPNGNLYQHLHEFSPSLSKLSWESRLRIAVGTAKAICYLHHDCKPQILHLNIKSTNILLDEHYESKLTDYGLGKLLPMLDTCGVTMFHSAAGYLAPELAHQSIRISDKCDVYSFGVVLLEIVTGRKPVESRLTTEVVVLSDYVRRLFEAGRGSASIDGSLSGYVESEVMQVLRLGLVCTLDDPSRRPNINPSPILIDAENPRHPLAPDPSNSLCVENALADSSPTTLN